jgi:cell division protein FtsL
MNTQTGTALAEFTQPKAAVSAARAHTGSARSHESGLRLDGSRFTALVLLFAVVCSGVMLVYSRHEARMLYRELESLSAAHDEQQIEWGRLQLEQATWSENSRIEQIARDRLGLDFPLATNVVVIKQ